MPTDAQSGPPAVRKRGKAPSLTEKDIVDAALEVIRSEGVDALSMRRLSRELKRSAMAPSHHFRREASVASRISSSRRRPR